MSLQKLKKFRRTLLNYNLGLEGKNFSQSRSTLGAITTTKKDLQFEKEFGTAPLHPSQK